MGNYLKNHTSECGLSVLKLSVLKVLSNIVITNFFQNDQLKHLCFLF